MYSGGGQLCLCAGAVDLDDIVEVAWHVFELVHQTLAVHFVEDAALIVVPAELAKQNQSAW